MKKISLLVFAFVLCATMLHAQKGDVDKFDIKWGGLFELPKKYSEIAFLGNEEDGFVQFSQKSNKEMLIHQFDKSTLRVKKTKYIDLKEMPDKYMTDLIQKWGDSYYMFYSFWDKGNQTEHLRYKEFDLEKGNFTKVDEEVLKSKPIAGTLVATGFYQFATANKYKFRFSNDSTKVLISYRLKPKIKDDGKNYDIIGFHVFDRELNKLWGSDFKMPYTEARMNNVSYEVDSDGNAYLLAKVYENGRKEAIDGVANYHYELFKFAEGSSQPEIINIDLSDKFVRQFYIGELSGEDGLICTGYYSTEAKGSSSDGVFMVKVSPDGSVSNLHKGYYEFPSEILQQFESDRTKRKIDKKDSGKDKESEVKGLRVREVIISENGDIVINGEQYIEVTRTYYSNGKMYTRTTYYFLDILTMKIDSDGEMEWVRKIPKAQKGVVGTGGLSYKYYSYGEDNYYFFIDNVKNLVMSKDETPAYHADGLGGFLVVVKVDKDGNVSKGKFFDIRSRDLYFKPVNFDQLTETTMMGRAYIGAGDGKGLYGMRSKPSKSKILKITFEP